jgi:hypothetical protein
MAAAHPTVVIHAIDDEDDDDMGFLPNDEDVSDVDRVVQEPPEAAIVCRLWRWRRKLAAMCSDGCGTGVGQILLPHQPGGSRGGEGGSRGGFGGVGARGGEGGAHRQP